MNFLIIDLEATCDVVNVQPDMEIIEIGAVLCNETGDIISAFQTFVKPIVNPVLTDFCKNLTHITQEDVDKAPYFKSAMLNLLSWLSDKKYVFCSWGLYDRNQLMQDCARHGIAFPLGILHINIKNEYAKIKGVKRMGVGKALAQSKMEFEGTPHRGIDDARNIARLFKNIVSNIIL